MSDPYLRVASLEADYEKLSVAYRQEHGELLAAKQRIAELETERDKFRKFFLASEQWREAYSNGKYEMYSMGGAVQKAAVKCLPCNEGSIDRMSWRTYSGLNHQLKHWLTVVLDTCGARGVYDASELHKAVQQAEKVIEMCP